jgi:hypothetical protein
MTSAALSDPFYIQLKTTFISTMESNITSNKNAPISSFKEKSGLISHLDVVSGWEGALDAFKKLCDSIETTPSPESAPIQNVGSPTITEGEIVE